MKPRNLIIEEKNSLTLRMAAAFIAPLLAFTPLNTNAADWEWQIAPYLWASDVGLDATFNSDPVLGVNIPFNDLLNKVDMAFMGHFEGRGEKFGVLADAIYLDLGDQSTTTVGPGGPISGDLAIATDMKLSLYELGGIYRMGSAEPGTAEFDFLFGARLVDVDQTLNIILPGPAGTSITRSIDVAETDVFIGGRVIGKFNDRWGYGVRADFGGGGTDGTFNALGAIEYEFGETGLFSIDIGYRYMNIEMSDTSNGSVTESEVKISGPFVGFVFEF